MFATQAHRPLSSRARRAAMVRLVIDDRLQHRHLGEKPCTLPRPGCFQNVLLNNVLGGVNITLMTLGNDWPGSGDWRRSGSGNGGKSRPRQSEAALLWPGGCAERLPNRRVYGTRADEFYLLYNSQDIYSIPGYLQVCHISPIRSCSTYSVSSCHRVLIGASGCGHLSNPMTASKLADQTIRSSRCHAVPQHSLKTCWELGSKPNACWLEDRQNRRAQHWCDDRRSCNICNHSAEYCAANHFARSSSQHHVASETQHPRVPRTTSS